MGFLFYFDRVFVYSRGPLSDKLLKNVFSRFGSVDQGQRFVDLDPLMAYSKRKASVATLLSVYACDVLVRQFIVLLHKLLSKLLLILAYTRCQCFYYCDISQ